MLTVTERLEAAERHRAAGRSDEAMLLYESALDQNPNNARVLKEVALVLLERGEVEKAAKTGARAAGIAADDANVLEGFARICLAAGKDREAEAVIDQALIVEPTHPASSLMKSQFCTQRGEVTAAETLLADSLAQAPENTDLLVGLSMFYQQHGLLEPALAYCQRARMIDPENVKVKAAVGHCLAGSGNAKPALPLLEEAYLAEPKNPLFMLAYTSALADAGELTEAERLATRAKTLYPRALPAWQLYVAVKLRTGQGREALQEFTDVARSHPEKAGALLSLATAYRQAGEFEQALKLAQPLLGKEAAVPDSRSAMARAIVRDCLLCLGRYELAREILNEIDFVKTRESDKSNDDGRPKPEDSAAALADAALMIDGGMSSLETIALIRFWLDTKSGKKPLKVFGVAAFRQLLSLFGVVDYTAVDQPPSNSERVPEEMPQKAFPLSHILALPMVQHPKIGRTVPYIKVRAGYHERWMQALGELPRPWVALAWSPNRPGLLLEDYRSVFDGFSGTLIGLMWDDGRHQLAEWPEIIDAGVHFKSMHELVGMLSCVDMVLGPDGIAMHVAGAMGQPGAVLTQPDAPWYWYAEDRRSVWYPSLEVLRTADVGNWAVLIEELKDGIQIRVNRPSIGVAGESGLLETQQFDEECEAENT
jgi:tetratricopeptide (TPR) repeat protein